MTQITQHPIGVSMALLYQPVIKGHFMKHNNPVVFLLWIQTLLPLIVWTVCGWVVARVDIQLSKPRIQYRRDLVIVFASWMLLLHLLLIGPAISTVVAAGASHLVIPLAAYAVASLAAILLGGSLHRQKAQPIVTANDCS